MWKASVQILTRTLVCAAAESEDHSNSRLEDVQHLALTLDEVRWSCGYWHIEFNVRNQVAADIKPKADWPSRQHLHTASVIQRELVADLREARQPVCVRAPGEYEPQAGRGVWFDLRNIRLNANVAVIDDGFRISL